MKKSLAHLPEHKQKELEMIKDIVLEKIEDVRMIVLFGSYARGNWVEDIHTEGHTTPGSSPKCRRNSSKYLAASAH
jgi:hypothetical protein